MRVNSLELVRQGNGVAIYFEGAPMIAELGAGIPLDGRWRWSFDGSLELTSFAEEQGADPLGEYTALALTYADEGGPLLRQRIRAYRSESGSESGSGSSDGSGNGAYVVVEATALRDLPATSLKDSFFHTTFNCPVALLDGDLSYLTYTWGLEGGEGTGIGGHFPDAAIAPDLASLPEQLRLAGFSPTADLRLTVEKPFAPLVAYNDREQTLVMSPLNHFLISPMRLIDTPRGVGVARGLHGAVEAIPAGATTLTSLVFGRGLAATVMNWGSLLLQLSGKGRGRGRDNALVKSLGFWNCYGGYYADLFRPTDADTLTGLAEYFREADLPVRYFGLDLWYEFDTVGFSRSYRPHPDKYPQGLTQVHRETGLPFLLHMSAFDPANAYLNSYDFVVEEGSSYPAGPEFYRDRAGEFKEWGALGIWPDFLRTQLQNCHSLRSNIGAAEDWFEGLCRAMGGEGLEIMLCMPTVGHYLASTLYDNIIAVRTSTDYVNHQPGQLELLSSIEEYRSPNTSLRNLRQNLLLSLLAGAVGLAPSYDVFISNPEHPEGFADPNAHREALVRALSSGIVGLGDKAGWVDGEVVKRLAFPDGTLSQPDHPPFPVAATLRSPAPAFYTTTAVGHYRWTFLTVFNLSEEDQDYRLDLEPFLAGGAEIAYDYLSGDLVTGRLISGRLGPGMIRYLVIPPAAGGLHLLGFPDKYVTCSRRQVRGVTLGPEGVEVDLDLPAGEEYSFSALVSRGMEASGAGIDVLEVTQEQGQAVVRFRVDSPRCSLLLRG